MSANGTYIAYGTYSGQVLVWDTQLGTNIYTNSASFPVISPDGSRLLYQNLGTSTARVQDLVHGTNMLTVTGAPGIRSPGGLERRRAVCRPGYFLGHFGTGRQ